MSKVEFTCILKLAIKYVFPFLFSILMMSCSTFSENRSPGKAMMPVYEVEATIVILTPDKNIECEGNCPGYEYPIDTGIIKIDKIISVTNPDNVGLNGYKKGDRIEVRFLYSSRPAKIIYTPASSSATSSVEPEKPVSSDILNKPISKQDGLFVYEIETSSVDQAQEVFLSGLEEGMKIKTNISLESPSSGLIMKYTIID